MKCQLGHLSWSLPISLCPRVRQAWKGNECIISFESQASGDSIYLPLILVLAYCCSFSNSTSCHTSQGFHIFNVHTKLLPTPWPQFPELLSSHALTSTSPQLITPTVTAWALSGPNCSPSTGHFTPPPNKSSPLIFPRVPVQHHTWPQQAFDPTMHQASFPCSSPFLSSSIPWSAV